MIAQNLQYLRKRNKISQQKLADHLGIARSTLGDYERGKTEPNIEMLLKISKHFDVTVDALINSNISHRDLEIIRNKDMKILAISVDSENKQNIELVDRKAEAGYLESFHDPEYIRDLPKLHFPGVPDGSYRAFEIQGDSMLPMAPGSIVICSYIESLHDLKDDKTYVIISNQEGVVYKRIKNHEGEKQLTAISDNAVYPPYTISYTEIAEVWQYFAHLSFSDAKVLIDHWLEDNIVEIRKQLDDISSRLPE